MENRLYVGNLPFDISEDQLHELFAAHGEVTSARLITDFNTGRSRGFGFVEMENDADAMTAIEKFHDMDFQGRKLTVSEARPQERRF